MARSRIRYGYQQLRDLACCNMNDSLKSIFKMGLSLSEDEYKKYLETLGDDADKAEELGVQSDNESQDQKEESVDHPSDSMDDTDKEGLEEPHQSSSINSDSFGSGY